MNFGIRSVFKRFFTTIVFSSLPRTFYSPHIIRMSSNICAPCVFNAKSDIYKGLTIDTNGISMSDSAFEENLNTSLSDWMSSGIRGVWFKVFLAQSSYVPILVKFGFTFHHAKTSYVMMTRWLPADKPNLLPQYPHTHIGVGGIVVNSKNQVLTIQEKYRAKQFWKFPGGYSNPGENVGDTAKREVYEETGVETEFVSVIAFRHHHQHIFDCSDIYFVCHLRPLHETITKSDDEVEQCQWMDIETFRNHPQATDFNKFLMDVFLDNQKIGKAIKNTPVLSFTKDCYHLSYHIQSSKDTDSSAV